MNVKILCTAILLFFIFNGCSQPSKGSIPDLYSISEVQSVEEESAADYESNSEKGTSESSSIRDISTYVTNQNKMQSFASSSAAKDLSFGDRQFIRTAELNFKVKDLVKTTYQLEDITLQHYGFVVRSEIRNEELSTEQTDISLDSSLVRVKYQLNTNLILRVPIAELDSTLKDISPLVGMMTSRVVSATDVSLSLLAEQLKQNRERAYNEDIAVGINKQRNKLDDVVDAQTARRDAQENADRSYLSSLSTKDKIEYSTITINLTQNPIFEESIVAKSIVIKEYQPSFGNKLKNAFFYGCNFITKIFLIFVYIWPLLLFGIAGFFIL